MATGREMTETSSGGPIARAVRFIREVRQEVVGKVTWPSRKETGITTAMVFVMVLIMSLFFLLVDMVLGGGVNAILSWGS
jgi:preprotein translocase subunit SecE